MTGSLDVEPIEGAADSGELGEDLSDLFVAVGEAAREQGSGVVFLLDEIQFLDRHELEALIRALHRVSQRQLPLVLAGAELHLLTKTGREYALRRALEPLIDDYDFVLIDCPPSLSLLTLNGLCSAHGVIVPMQCEYFALEGLSDLVNTIKQVHANLNPSLQVIGILRVMFDARITLQGQVSEQLKAHFGDKVFDTVIPRNVRLAEAPSYGMPGVVFDPASKGALAFVEFAREMAARVESMPVERDGG